MYESITDFLKTNAPGTVIFTNIFFVAFMVVILSLTRKIAGAKDSSESRSANLLTALLGGLCGWIIGMAFAPFTPVESSQFISISNAVSVFLSGYVVSKLDRFLEGALFPVDKSPNSWARVGLFTAALLLASVTVFTNRLYAFKDALPVAVSQAGVSVELLKPGNPPTVASSSSTASTNVPQSGTPAEKIR